VTKSRSRWTVVTERRVVALIRTLAQLSTLTTEERNEQTCLVCGRYPADAHHLRFAQSQALGRKVSDEFTVPLCRNHREVHRSGDEAAWWKKAGIDSSITARALSLETHPLPAIQIKRTPMAGLPLRPAVILQMPGMRSCPPNGAQMLAKFVVRPPPAEACFV
jgi:hypothetical protein